MKKLLLLLLFAIAASAQIYGPCEDPFLNPNIRLQYIGQVCTAGDPVANGCDPFTDACFDVYHAYDTYYQEDCGNVWDQVYCENLCLRSIPKEKNRAKSLLSIIRARNHQHSS